MTIKKKKKDPKSYFLISGDPQTCPGANFLHHCILLCITFDLICNMTVSVQNGFSLRPGGCGFDLGAGHTKDFKNGTSCSFAWCPALRK